MMTKLLPKIKIKPQLSHLSNRMDPHWHWIIILRLFSLVVLCLIAFSFYLLYEIKNEQAFQVTTTTIAPQNLIKDKTLQSVTESFVKKAEEEKTLQDNPKVYADPSL